MPLRLFLAFLCTCSLPMGIGCNGEKKSELVEKRSPAFDSVSDETDPRSVAAPKRKAIQWFESENQFKVNENRSRELATRSVRLADHLKAMGKHSEAENAYRTAMSIDKAWPYPVYQYACNQQIRGESNEAWELFKKAYDVGLADFPTVVTDNELGPIRYRPEFNDLLAEIRQRYQEKCDSWVGVPLAFKPKTYKEGRRYPIILMMHGYGDSHGSYVEGAAEWTRNGFLAVVVPGTFPIREGAGFQWSNKSIGPTHQALQEILQSPLLKNSIDYEKVFLLGFSQGGLHALLLTAKYPEHYQGVVAVSPGGFQLKQLANPSLSDDQQRRVVVVHGAQEGLGRMVEKWKDACLSSGWRFREVQHQGGHHFPIDWDKERPRAARFLMQGL